MELALTVLLWTAVIGLGLWFLSIVIAIIVAMFTLDW